MQGALDAILGVGRSAQVYMLNTLIKRELDLSCRAQRSHCPPRRGDVQYHMALLRELRVNAPVDQTGASTQPVGIGIASAAATFQPTSTVNSCNFWIEWQRQNCVQNLGETGMLTCVLRTIGPTP